MERQTGIHVGVEASDTGRFGGFIGGYHVRVNGTTLKRVSFVWMFCEGCFGVLPMHKLVNSHELFIFGCLDFLRKCRKCLLWQKKYRKP